MDPAIDNLRKTTLLKIAQRNAAQLPSMRNSMEPLLLSPINDQYGYGRWFLGRDENGRSIIRPRRAGLSPRFHDHSYIDDVSVLRNMNLNPRFPFQYPSDGDHRYYTGNVITYR